MSTPVNGSPVMGAPTSPSRKAGFFGIIHKKSSDGAMTPGGMVTTIAQTPLIESSNPMDKLHIPVEAREQQIVGLHGEKIDADVAKILIALDGSEAGDRAFRYLVENNVMKESSHVILTTVLPANVVVTPWVSGPLSIDIKKQNEMLKQMRSAAIEKLDPYKSQLKARGFSVTIHVLHGDARASLLRVIGFHECDLVLVGKRNRSWKKGLTSGTVSSYLVSHSPAPVLVIK
ncbi:adenine nucleotide alpha hydrolases-like protein [Violaceomyces palustris]|uniref:Adenine nucleotide alpha hydrolases-like protein n=1 Tax=Violaceomyces palustris TaxID=1673888 RepID=A0ACD0NTG2_9BASI|nr:adenine nucleotide alpha hydrolases-like protein [Violaceomyces palustris]